MVTVTVCFADPFTEPVTVTAGPVPMVASVVTLESETATSGVISLPPGAPFCAVVVIVSALTDSSVTSCAPERPAPAPMPAWVVPLPMFTATDAPMPAAGGGAVAGVAVAVLPVVELAFASTFAPPAVSDAAGLTSAAVAVVATLIARAPATIGLELASDVAPRPEVAVADAVPVGACASMIRFGMPLSVGEPSTNAFVVMSTMFTEIATPVAAPPPLTGLASAVALELCFEPAWIFRSCAAVIVPLPARDDWVVPVRRLNAIAAPTTLRRRSCSHGRR